MKRKFYITILCTLTILLLFLVNLKVEIPKFNSNNFIKVTKDLSSDFYKGRMMGTIENAYAAYYLKDKLSENNIDINFEKFTSQVPVKEKALPYIRIYDKNSKLVKEYKYGQDFKEDMGSFKVNNVKFSKKDKVAVNDFYIQIFKDNTSFLLLNPQDDYISFRSSFIKGSPYSLVFLVNKDTLNEINKFISNGCSVSMSTPIHLENKTLSNVVGVIKGKDSSYPPLILTAHFDHVGTDFMGNIYNGALDNASGVSFLMETAKYIKSLGTPDGDIYVVFFNGEEGGFLGSSDFLSRHIDHIKNGKVINFDMIGSSSVPLCIMTGEKDSPEDGFAKEMSKICRSYGLNFNFLYQDSSDHAPFRAAKINAITFCDNDSSKIHTLNDTCNFIEKEGGERCFQVVSKELLKYEYGRSIIHYVDYIIVIIFGLAILFLVLFFKTKNRNKS